MKRCQWPQGRRRPLTVSSRFLSLQPTPASPSVCIVRRVNSHQLSALCIPASITGCFTGVERRTPPSSILRFTPAPSDSAPFVSLSIQSTPASFPLFPFWYSLLLSRSDNKRRLIRLRGKPGTLPAVYWVFRKCTGIDKGVIWTVVLR